MRELVFVVDSLLALVVGAFLLRFLFQVVRADFRNPFARAIVKVTDPVIVPLRRILPPVGRIDTASVVALLAVQMIRMAVVGSLAGGVPAFLPLLLLAVVRLVDLVLLVVLVAIFVYVLLSWISPGSYSPVGRLLGSLVEPVLAPARRLIPPLGGIDLSPIAVILLISVVRMALSGRIEPLLAGLG